MHDDVEGHATRKRQHERLQAFYADPERAPLRVTVAAMLSICAAVRRIDRHVRVGSAGVERLP